MEYIEITAAVAVADAEPASDVLRSVTGGDVWIETPFTQADLESDAVVSTSGTSVVRAYAREGDDAARLVAAARERLAGAGIASEVSQRRVAEEDWAEAWKEYFHVERFGERIVVVPSWRTYDAQPGDAVLTLDPGMAFGTGQHETTRMCLEALERVVVPGMSVLDVGSGSGILAIAAAKLGAQTVHALDVDANCERVARENAHANGVDDVVRIARGSLGVEWPAAWPGMGAFDVVVANIIARVIIELSVELVGSLRSGGRLIVSGVIGSREDEVVAAISVAGARVESCRAMGEWRCVEAVRG